MTTAAELARSLKAKRSGIGWIAKCPAHDDRTASLSIHQGEDGRILLHCHAGCRFRDIMQAAGVEPTRNGADHKTKSRTVATYDYHDASGNVVFQAVRMAPKDFRQRRRNGDGWIWDMNGVERVPYRLPALLEANEVFVCEGEKDCDNLAKLGLVATTNPGGAGKWPASFGKYFDGRHVVILPDNDDPGRKHGQDVAQKLAGHAATLKILELPNLPVKGDVSDFLAAGGTRDDLEALAAAAPEWEPQSAPTADPEPEDEFIREARRLAQLPPHEYDRVRKAEATRLGVRTATLDAAVDDLRNASKAGDSVGKGNALDLTEPEPWGEPVEGAELIADLVEQIVRYVALSDHAALAAALWVIHTHGHEAAFHSPRLTITSPTMRCGKSTLLRTIGRLVPRPLPTANITPAAMFRVIEAAKPTLLIDEADSFANENEELRGVINSSHCRLDAFVVRAVPVADDYEARRFSTWSPMAIASIGRIASTIADRSVTIAMERKPRGVTVARMRADRDDGFGVLASKTARWVADHLDALRAADPDVPRVLNDRQADNWRLMLAIADLVGAHWPEQARTAALALSAADEDADTIGVQLLADMQIVFDTTKAAAIWTEDLLRHLHDMSERPWCEYGRQRKPISPRQLASLLKPFGIVTKGQVWNPSTKENKRGYTREQFSAAWGRYLSANVLDATESASFSDFLCASDDPPLAHENPPKAAETASVSTLAHSNPLPPEDDEFDRWIRPS